MAGMTLELAEECIGRVKAKATELSINLSIAVLDEAGRMVAFARMGTNSGGFGEKLAIAKARTAVGFRRTTQESLERYANLPANYYIVNMSSLYPGEFCVTPGGAPILVKGELLGGVGVSGSTAENDHKCVTEAIAGIGI
jgi:uncharacterized protein GlcG (DUF336 family)